MTRFAALVVPLLCFAALTCANAAATPLPTGQSSMLSPGQPSELTSGQPGLLCREAIEAAARAHGVPPSLMAAVGRVESGRRDPLSGAFHPWPWTVDAEGQGSFYDSKAQAIEAVRALQARGVRSIDVGCMQVNLMHHPHAFASLEQAFDPASNTDYAARYLTELHSQAGDWPGAAALYHSATPELAAAYRQKVMAAWPIEQRLSGELAAVGQINVAAAMPGSLLLSPPVRSAAGLRIVPRGAVTTGAGLPRRGLDAYRAAPILPGWRRAAG